MVVMLILSQEKNYGINFNLHFKNIWLEGIIYSSGTARQLYYYCCPAYQFVGFCYRPSHHVGIEPSRKVYDKKRDVSISVQASVNLVRRCAR